MTEINPSSRLGALVAETPALAGVFEKWGLDYCCSGNRTLADASRQAGIDIDAVVGEMSLADQAREETLEPDWSHARLTQLADHIEHTHHRYLKAALPGLSGLIAKVVGAHGAAHPELRNVQTLFERMRSELELHTRKEERILFPLCRLLDRNEEFTRFECGSIRNPIFVMEMDHSQVGYALNEIRRFTRGFRLPSDGCAAYREMLSELEALEGDLHTHIHKENNILFPRAIARESELLESRVEVAA